MARHEPGWVCGSHTGSALRLLSRSVLEPLLGVMVSMTWPSAGASPCQWKWASRSPGARTCRAPTTNRSRASSRAARLAAESMPAPGDHHELGNVVGGLDGLHDGDDRGGLSLGPLPAADLERKTGPVDQQAHDDLRIDPTLLGVTDLAQVVLEVQGGDVVQAQGQTGGVGDVIEQGLRDRLAVAPLLGPGQAGLQGVAVGRGWPADLGQDSWGVGLGGRLDHARDDHLLKGPITPSGAPSPRRA